MVNCLKTPHLIIPSNPILFIHHYTNLVDCFDLNTSHPTILSHPLHPSPESMWPKANCWILVIWLSYPTFFIRLQGVCQLTQLSEYPTSDYHPIPSSSSVSRLYVNTLNCLNTPQLTILSHLSSPVYVNLISYYKTSDLIWSSHPHPLQPPVRELNQLFLRPLIWLSHPHLSRKYVNLINYF